MNTWSWFQPLSFQVIWIAAVLGGNQWLAVPLVTLCLHFVLSPCRQQDVRILPMALIGISLDSTLTQLGIYSFEQLPVWLFVLWIGFVLNFGHSLKFIRNLKTHWLIIIGSIGGCYAYLASWKLGAVSLPYGTLITACVLTLVWAIIFPLLVKTDLYLRERNHG